MNGEDFHVADLVEAEAVGPEGRGAAEPFNKVAHLIGENVLISHGINLRKGGGVENAFWSPKDFAGGSRGIDGIQEAIGQGFIGLIEGEGEVLEHVIGEGGAEKVDPALGDACADTLVKGRTIRAGVTTFGPF